MLNVILKDLEYSSSYSSCIIESEWIMKGYVKRYNVQEGFGIIESEDGQDIYVHHDQISGEGYKNLNAGDEVKFTIEEGDKGLEANDVVVIRRIGKK